MHNLGQRSKSIEEWADQHFIDPHGIVYSALDKNSGCPLTADFFDPESEPHLSGVSLADFWNYENCGMTTGAYLQALVCRYEIEHDPAALERAKRCYRALRHIYDMGRELEEGFFPKIYGARFSRQTSTDQVLYAAMALDKYAPHAGAEDRRDISLMIAHMVRFWVKRKYRFGYYHIPDMLWPLARFPSLLLLAFNHSGEQLFKEEYGRLLVEGVNRYPGESRLRRKLSGETSPNDFEKQQHAWLISHTADAVTMDVMELDYLLRHDPSNEWADTWRKSAALMWREAALTLAPNGKAYTSVLVDMDTGRPRRVEPFSCPGLSGAGATTGWSTMIARAGVQAAPHLPGEKDEITRLARRVLEALDIQDLTYWDEPEIFEPKDRFKTRFLSGDAITNWLWAYWLGRNGECW
jgi:hypothetical protein